MNTQNLSMSVVIVAYNEEKYIQHILECIQKQSFQEFELVVVDNNSTDKTAYIAKKYGARVIAEKSQGYIFALNKGLHEAKGEIVAVTDADTKLDYDWLKKIHAQFENPQIVAITGSLHYATSSKLVNWLVYTSYDLFIRINFLLGKPHFTGTCMAFRRSTLQKIGQLNTKYKIGGDVDLGLQANRFGKVLYVPSIGVITSPRRWKKDALGNLFKYVKAYFYVVWLRREVKSSLKPAS